MAYSFKFHWNPFRRQNSRVPEIILVLVLTLLVTGSVVFGVGMVHYGSVDRPKPPEVLKNDPTFYILLSQSLVNILTSSCTLASVMKDGPRAGFRNQPSVCIAALLAMILAISVPGTYVGTAKGAAKRTQVKAMVVNFCSGICTISAAIFLANLGPRNGT